MKCIVIRFKPDSYEVDFGPIRVFDTWELADKFVAPLQDKGERGWRIQYAWEVGEEIPKSRFDSSERCLEDDELSEKKQEACTHRYHSLIDPTVKFIHCIRCGNRDPGAIT